MFNAQCSMFNAENSCTLNIEHWTLTIEGTRDAEAQNTPGGRETVQENRDRKVPPQ
jgi:hypothetical protein